ncbi:hypothetical protein PHLGIDRAFT_19531 [Phlebiopsis gigantea 11061_1 CR5-6]|uniref:Uncharacterized protein n=1 Tax=Phlebiopsis gigantea (strain 11061_1 CR5-6) TaxID=745531 RepID=A0A0C3S9E5_PHLG1|nr:hypothetical protein PHLGIDRAFT_19531 [Phlebiopsis gigantea 11061_1 CR5-6]
MTGVPVPLILIAVCGSLRVWLKGVWKTLFPFALTVIDPWYTAFSRSAPDRCFRKALAGVRAWAKFDDEALSSSGICSCRELNIARDLSRNSH